MPQISFNLIVKGQPDSALRALASIQENLYEAGDEYIVVDTGSSPEDLKVLRDSLLAFPDSRLIERPDLQVNYVERIRKWIPDCEEEWSGQTGLRSFAEARNVALEASTKPLIFWIDSDDVLHEDESGALRKHINEKLPEDYRESEVQTFFLDYRYGFAEDGSLTTILKRERVFYRELFHWVGACHETAIPKGSEFPVRPGGFDGLGTYVMHTEARKPHRQSDIRNYVILRQDLEDTEDLPDPRTIFYLANAAKGLERLPESIGLYKWFLELSGSRDDRFAAAYYVAQSYLDPQMSRPIDAIDAFRVCIDIRPDDPRGHFGLSRAYLQLRRWDDCLREYERGCKMTINAVTEIHSVDPTHVNYHPHIVASLAAKEKGDAEKSVQIAQHALRARPNFKHAHEHMQYIAANAAGDLLSDSVLHVLGNLEHGGPNAQRVGRTICDEFTIIPPKLEKAGLSKIESADPRPEGRPTVAIFCGGSAEPWGEPSAETGIGGSEKMVLQISGALQARGCNVTVYGEVPYPDRGVSEKTGVLWRHWAEMDYDRPVDVLVVWRMPSAIVQLPVPAKKRILWLHDVPNPSVFTDEVLATVDLIQVQSEYHAGLLEDCGVPREKLWVSRNAINTSCVHEVLTRNPKQVIFFSSPDRGLLTACAIVAEAQKTDPGISLVAAYGINPWARVAARHRHVPDVGHDIDFDLYERRLFAALDAVGGKCLGRVSFADVSALLKGSGVWLYPTRFPEISCMAAMESQAHGVIPVTTNYGALAETVLTKAALPPVPPGEPRPEFVRQAAAELVKACAVLPNAPSRERLARRAWKAYNLGGLAEDWISKLLLGPAAGSGGPAAGASGERAASPEELVS
jgi:glycosyltransferase involved in cell wall biosynthesis/tetratricopeptide (TPR) repeat protein